MIVFTPISCSDFCCAFMMFIKVAAYYFGLPI